MNVKGDANRSVQQTKRRLGETLTELMLQKPVEQITVRELTTKAGVSRGTFYFHYSDIYALLKQQEDACVTQIETFVAELEPTASGTALPPALLAIFRYLDENNRLFRALYGPNGTARFREKANRMAQCCCDGALPGNVYSERYEFLRAFQFGGFMGAVQAWLAQSPRAAPETIARAVWRAAHAVQSLE